MGCRIMKGVTEQCMARLCLTVGSRFKPIVGLDASCRLRLLTVNCPVYQSWTRSNSIDSISGADADIPKMISKDWIVNNPKYKHLFQGIGRFKSDPVQIKLTQNAIPVQKPPRRVLLARKDQFKQELDNMVSQGILSKLDDANVNAPEWLNSFLVVKKPNGKLLNSPITHKRVRPFLVLAQHCRVKCNYEQHRQDVARTCSVQNARSRFSKLNQ